MTRLGRKRLPECILLSLGFLCFFGLPAGADGMPDVEDPSTTGAEIAQQATSQIEQLISAGSMKRPYVYQGKLYYNGQSLKSVPLDSMLELLQFYTDDELLNVTDITLLSCKFASIEGLSHLPNLRILDLGGNRIIAISGLEDVPLLEIINLSQNRIERIEGLESLPNMRELHLSNNRIKRIEGLDSLEKLEVLMLEGNQITEISGLGRLTALRRLGLAGNRLRDVGGLLELGDLNDLSIRSLYNQLDDKALETIAEWNRRHSDNPFVQL